MRTQRNEPANLPFVIAALADALGADKVRRRMRPRTRALARTHCARMTAR
jgi:hypothetical protein